MHFGEASGRARAHLFFVITLYSYVIGHLTYTQFAPHPKAQIPSTLCKKSNAVLKKFPSTIQNNGVIITVNLIIFPLIQHIVIMCGIVCYQKLFKVQKWFNNAQCFKFWDMQKNPLICVCSLYNHNCFKVKSHPFLLTNSVHMYIPTAD